MMGYHPENAEANVAKTEEEKNEVVHQKFKKLGEKEKERTSLNK